MIPEKTEKIEKILDKMTQRVIFESSLTAKQIDNNDPKKYFPGGN